MKVAGTFKEPSEWYYVHHKALKCVAISYLGVNPSRYIKMGQTGVYMPIVFK